MTCTPSFRVWLIEDNALFRRTVGRIVEALPGIGGRIWLTLPRERLLPA